MIISREDRVKQLMERAEKEVDLATIDGYLEPPPHRVSLGRESIRTGKLPKGISLSYAEMGIEQMYIESERLVRVG